MVIQNARKYGLRYQARVQIDMYDDLFERRLNGEKLYLNKAMEAQFLEGKLSPEEKKIGQKILRWHEQQIPLIELELFKQKKRLVDAERSLEKKETKKVLEDIRISSNKIEKALSDLEKHKTTKIVTESEERIFPQHYMSMLCLDENGEKVVMPVRYLMRPHNKDESFDVKFNGCYNARFDSLDTVVWWRDSIEKRHGILLIKKFYENVEAKEYTRNHKLPKKMKDREKLVLAFEPDNVEYMFVPTVWDVWKKKEQSPLYSAALITDEPLPEIAAAGHDRTPIFLKESAIDNWLNAINQPIEEIKEVLQERERPHYSHRVMGAA